MIRFVVLLLCSFGLLFLGSPAEGGWLDDKLKDVAEKVADKAIDEAVDEASEEDEEAESQGEQDEQDDPDAVDEDYEGDTYMGEEEFNVQDDEYFDEPGAYSGQTGLAAKCSRYDRIKIKSEDKDKNKELSIRDNLHFTAELKVEDLTGESADGTSVVYIDGARLRFDMNSGGSTQMSLIVLGTKIGDKTYSLYHTEHMYAESTLDEDSIGMWAVTSDEEPCEGYRNATKVGTETLAGRRAMKWSCTDADPTGSAPDVLIWRDEKLNVFLATEDACHRSTLVRFAEGSPDSKLFSVPEGYRELKMPAGMGKP